MTMNKRTIYTLPKLRIPQKARIFGKKILLPSQKILITTLSFPTFKPPSPPSLPVSLLFISKILKKLPLFGLKKPILPNSLKSFWNTGTVMTMNKRTIYTLPKLRIPQKARIFGKKTLLPSQKILITTLSFPTSKRPLPLSLPVSPSVSQSLRVSPPKIHLCPCGSHPLSG